MLLIGYQVVGDAVSPPHPASNVSGNNMSIGATAPLRVTFISRVPFVPLAQSNAPQVRLPRDLPAAPTGAHMDSCDAPPRAGISPWIRRGRDTRYMPDQKNSKRNVEICI